MAQKPILISGAGLASLLLAQSLRRSKIPFQIFERDASLRFRGQGYRLRLSTEGLDAIESVLDEAAFQKFWDRCGKTGGMGLVGFDAITGEDLGLDGDASSKKDSATTTAKTGDKDNNTSSTGDSGAPLIQNVLSKAKEFFKEGLGSRGGQIVGIARGDMRTEFFSGLEEYVQFGKQVTGYELLEDGVQAIFTDGTKSEVGDMLVGGEGIRSAVAKQVSGGRLKVYDTGARGIHGQAPTKAFKGLGEGVFRVSDFSKDDGPISIITNVRSGDKDRDDIEFGWTMVGPPGTIKAPNDDYSIVGKTAADIAKALTAHWNPRFTPVFDQMNENEAAFWKITCSTPGGVPEWPNVPRVTVIGDAAHSMTPAGGIGANTAVRDSALLGRLLREAGGYKVGVTEAYEKEMRVYGSEAVGRSYGLASGQFKVSIDPATTPTV